MCENLEINSEGINIYTCPEPDCLCTFQKYGNLHKHLDSGDHRMKKNSLTLADKSKKEYIYQIQSKQAKLIKAATTITSGSTTKLKKGWALKKRRAVKRFSSNQTSFLRDAFIQGENPGHKCDPEEVAAKMRTARKNGCRLFSKHEFLSSNQIASYFSRMSLEKRKNT